MNKNILITGGGKRLGKQLSLNFAKIGYNVIIHFNQSFQQSNNTKDEILSIGGRCHLVKADIRNKKQVIEAVKSAVEEFGKLDILINNAGVFPKKSKLSELSDSLWDDTMNVNLRGQFYFAQAFAANSNNDARIINVGSVGGAEYWRGSIPYNVSKAAAMHLTRSLAIELAPDITVNCVAPGFIHLDEPMDNPILIPTDRIPNRKYGSALDVFDAVRFFAETNNYITGQILFVDGGYHLARRM